jgi:hypothetical protein
MQIADISEVKQRLEERFKNLETFLGLKTGQVMTEINAQVEGYRPLTTGYELPRERSLLDAVIRDMRRARVDFVIVYGFSIPPSVWRRGMRGDADQE